MAKSGEHKHVACVVCGAIYRQSRSDQLYCSSKCGMAAYKERHALGVPKTRKTVACAICGREMAQYRAEHKYCSPECATEADRRVKCARRTGEGKGWSRGRKLVAHEANRTCALCGKQFFKRPCYLRRGAKLDFCSQACRTTYLATHPEMFPVNGNKRSNGGKRSDLDNRYFRSAWEANYARYLNWLISVGQIDRWEYEPDTYEFPVKRGSKFYTPDFKVFNKDGSFEYHEVKGYMDQRSATKLDRMTRHFPGIRVILIDKDGYRELARAVKMLVPGWEGR